MTWIRIDTGFPTHELLGELAERLRSDPDRVGMALIRLWCRMAEHRPDGQIDQVPDTTLEVWAGWRGRRGAFAEAVRRSAVLRRFRCLRSYIPREQRDRILARDGHRCRRCGARSPLEIDHVYPSSRGGSNDDQNLQTLCSSCNAAKGDRVA